MFPLLGYIVIVIPLRIGFDISEPVGTSLWCGRTQRGAHSAAHTVRRTQPGAHAKKESSPPVFTAPHTPHSGSCAATRGAALR